MLGRSSVARLLGSIPKQKRYERTCPMCGKQFTTTKAGIYNSAPCRAKAQRQREKNKGHDAMAPTRVEDRVEIQEG